MELLNPEGAEVLASYDHYNWKRYAAITQNQYGKGTAMYLGCHVSNEMLREILSDILKRIGLWGQEQEVPFPVIIKKGINDFGKEIRYYLNYSPQVQEVKYYGNEAKDLLTEDKIYEGQTLRIEPWNLRILERKQEA